MIRVWKSLEVRARKRLHCCEWPMKGNSDEVSSWEILRIGCAQQSHEDRVHSHRVLGPNSCASVSRRRDNSPWGSGRWGMQPRRIGVQCCLPHQVLDLPWTCYFFFSFLFFLLGMEISIPCLSHCCLSDTNNMFYFTGSQLKVLPISDLDETFNLDF